MQNEYNIEFFDNIGNTQSGDVCLDTENSLVSTLNIDTEWHHLCVLRQHVGVTLNNFGMFTADQYFTISAHITLLEENL